MKTCNNCGSTTFDDMEMCFDCMTSFAEPIQQNEVERDHSYARLRVALANLFCYEMVLQKLEGRSLSVGSASENAIVIPQEQVASKQLEVFYAHGQIWAESVDPSMQATIGEMPLAGTVLMKSGTELRLGDATITVLED